MPCVSANLRLRFALERLWRRKWLAMCTLAVSLLASLVAYHLTPSLYQARAIVYVEACLPDTAVDLHAETQRISSSPILAQVLRSPGVDRLLTLAETENRLIYLQRHTQVTVNQPDHTLTIAFTAPSRADAAELANALAQVYQSSVTPPLPAPLSAAIPPPDDREVEARLQLQALENQHVDMARRYLPRHPLMQSLQADIDRQTVVLLRLVEQNSRSLIQSLDLLPDPELPALRVLIVGEARPQWATPLVGPAPMLAAGLLAGSLLGIAAALLDRRYRSSDEITHSLHLPILAAIPRTHGQQSESVRGRKVQVDPASEVADAYRSVRTAIYFGLPGHPSQTILITSPDRHEGKSTLASNLAIAMAQAGQRTLLLDADFQQSMQRRVFQLDDSAGLSTVLAGRRSLDQAIQRPQIKNLDLLTAGPTPSSPADILGGQVFENLLEELTRRYDQIIVDAPAALPGTEARTLSGLCDLTVLVLQADRSNRSAAIRARAVLSASGAALLGAVVNQVPRRKIRSAAYTARLPETAPPAMLTPEPRPIPRIQVPVTNK